MNVTAGKNQNSRNRGPLFERVEYKIMEDFKKTLSKRPWEYLEEGNYEKYLASKEPKKSQSSNRKELLQVYSEILNLIKDKQNHLNSQFVNPKYDLVKHDFKCICRNTVKFQYYQPQKHPKESELPELKKLEEELNLKEQDVKFEGEKAEIVSSRRGSEYGVPDPVVESYFHPKVQKQPETKRKEKEDKKTKHEVKKEKEGSKLVKLDKEPSITLNKYLESERSLSLEAPKKRASTISKEDRMDQMPSIPSLDIDSLHKETVKKEKTVKHKKKTSVAQSGSEDYEKKETGVDKVSHQEVEMKNDLLHLLEGVPVFCDLPKNRLVQLSRHFKLKSYFTNSSIILGGEVPQEFYIVSSGTVSSYVYHNNSQFNQYKRSYVYGDYFGEVFLMDDRVSDEFYIADTNVTVQAMNASVFREQLQDLFDSFRYRLKEISSYSMYSYSKGSTEKDVYSKEMEKIGSKKDTVKAHSVLGKELLDFLKKYPCLESCKNLEKLSKKFSYQEYLEKEILVDVCKKEDLFLVQRGVVSLQVYEQEFNRQLELLALGPGSYFFNGKFKSDLVSDLMERTSFVAKEKLVLLSLEVKYMEKYMRESLEEMKSYLENMYKSNYLKLEQNKYKMVQSDRSSSSAKSVREESEEVIMSSKTSETFKREEETENDDSSESSSSSHSVLSSSSREERTSTDRGSRPSKDDFSEQFSRTTYTKEESQEPFTGEEEEEEEEDEREQPSARSSLEEPIVSRKSFQKPEDVSIRSSLNQLESSRTESSVVSKTWEKEEQKESSRVSEEDLLKLSLNKINEVLRNVGVKEESARSKTESVESKRTKSSKTSEEGDFVNKIMNKIEDYKQFLYKEVKEDKKEEEDKTKDLEQDENTDEDKNKYEEQQQEQEEEEDDEQEELVKRITDEEFEMVRRNTLMAAHVKVSDTDVSSMSYLLSSRTKRGGTKESFGVEGSSNRGKYSKDSEVSSVGSDVRFIFNLNIPELEEHEKEEDKLVTKMEEENKDSSRVMGNDNFIDIRTLSSYNTKTYSREETGQMGREIQQEENLTEKSWPEKERSQESERIVYRQTSSSQMLTSRSTKENAPNEEDMSSIVKELEIDLDNREEETSKESRRYPSVESKESMESVQNIITKNYPTVESSIEGVMEAIRTRSISLEEEVEQEGEQQQQKEEEKAEKLETMEQVEDLEQAEEREEPEDLEEEEEREAEKSKSLDFTEIPSLQKIVSRVQEVYLNPELPQHSVTGSKFSSIEDVYIQLEKIEKLYEQNKPEKDERELMDEPKQESELSDELKDEHQLLSELKDQPELLDESKDDEKDLEFKHYGTEESLFDLRTLYKTQTFTGTRSISENIYDSEGDGVNTERSEKEEEENTFSKTFEELTNKITSELKMEGLKNALSMEGLKEQISIENLTREFSIDKITKEISNIGSSITSQISGAFSSKSSNEDEEEEEKENEGSTKLIITSIFDDIKEYMGEKEVKEVEEKEKEEQDDKEEVDKTKEYEQDENRYEEQEQEEEEKVKRVTEEEIEKEIKGENVLIDKYNLLSRISLDSPSEVTVTSLTDKAEEMVEGEELDTERSGKEGDESLLSTEREKEDKESELSTFRSDRELKTLNSDSENLSTKQKSTENDLVSNPEEKESLVTSEKEEKESLISTDREKEDKESELSTFRSDRELKTLNSTESEEGPKEDTESELSTFRSDRELKSLNSDSENLSTKQKSTENDLASNVEEKESLVTSEKEEKESYTTEQSLLFAHKEDDESFLTSEREDSGRQSTERESIDPTEKSLGSSTDKRERELNSTISMGESINDNSFLSTESESHVTSGSSESSEGLKTESREKSISSEDLNEEDTNSIISSVTSNTESSESKSSLEGSSRMTSTDSDNSGSKRTTSLESMNEEESIETISEESNEEYDDQVEEQQEERYYYEGEKEEFDEDYFDLEARSESEEEEELEYDEESILSIKNLLMSTLKNKYKSIGASYTAMDFEKTGKVNLEGFMNFIEKVGIGAIDHREQNIMFELLKEENEEYITFASFYKGSEEKVQTLKELNQHFISIFGSSRIAFEKYFTTLKKSTVCSKVDFAHMLKQVGIEDQESAKMFQELDVCKKEGVTVFTMLKLIVGDWNQQVAREYEQKINTNLNRLLTYLSPESLEEFNKEFSRTLSSHFFDQNVEGSLVNDSYEEFYIEVEPKYFDQLNSLLSEQKEFKGTSIAQKRFIVSLFNVVETGNNSQGMMQYASGFDYQEVSVVTSTEVDPPLVALIKGKLEMTFEGITYPKHLDVNSPSIPNYEQFQSCLDKYSEQPYPVYGENGDNVKELPESKEPCGYNLTFKLGPENDTVVGMMPLSTYLYNVVPLLKERTRRLPVMLQFLKSVESFNIYSPEELETIAGACTVRQFKLHETVIRTGETPTHFYLIFDGELTVKNEYNFEFKTIARSQFFSSYDIVNNQMNSFTLIANCSLVLLSWERNEFFRVFTKYSALVENDACNLNEFQNLSMQKLVDKKVSFAEFPQ